MYRTAKDRRDEAARHRQMTEEALKIPTISLKFCDYDKGRRVLKLASEFVGMPVELFVKSHHTGKTVRFKVVDQNDILFNEDGWDGECRVYRPIGVVPGVDHMYIYHQS